MVSDADVQAQLGQTLKGTNLDFLSAEKYEGKVRDNYMRDGRRLLVTTDKLSAFDRIITTIPFKGQVLNQISMFWFDLTKDICPSYLIDSPDPNVAYGENCEPLMVEMVVRGYITGSTGTSLWYKYNTEERRNIYGIDFPDGLEKNAKLPEPVLTPTTKAAKGDHDAEITPAEIVEQGLLTQEEWEDLAEKTLALYKAGVEHCAKQGVILVDTKYEFGKNSKGEIVLIDEIHTPDSSRFWIASTYDEKLAAGEEPDNINKEFLRLWLANQGYMGDGEMPEITDEIRVQTAHKYIEAYELITGKEFVPESGDTGERIQRNIKSFFKMES